MTAPRRRVAGAVLTAVVTLSPLVAAVLPAGTLGGPASAAAASGSPAAGAVVPAVGRTTSTTNAAVAAAAAATSSPVTVQIDAVSPDVLAPGQDLSVTATLVNTTGAELDGVAAGLRLNRYRAASRADLDAWATGADGAVGTRVVTGNPTTIPAGGSATVVLDLPAAKVQLLNLPDTWGPRGLAVEALAADGSSLGIQRTFLLWMSADAVPQVQVAVLAPVTGATLDAAALSQATNSGGRLQRLLDLATVQPEIQFAVDPALLAAATAAGGSPAAWSKQVSAALAPRATLVLPWGDTDLGAVAHAGQTQLLTMAMGMSAASPPAGAGTRTDVLWAPDGALDQQTVETAAAAGAHVVVVGTDTLQQAGQTTGATAQLDTAAGPLTALVPDRLLTTLLVDPDEVQSGATTATTVQRMLAELAVLSHNSTGAPPDVLLTPGREWTPDEPLVAALLHALDSSPWSRLVPVSTLIGADASNAARSSLPALAVNPDELAATQVQALADARNSVISFARAIDESSALTDGLDTSVLTPLSVGWRADPARRAALVNQVLTSTSATLAGLSVSGPPNLNVISANAPVRFVIDNRLNVAATVSVQVRPRKGCLRTVTSDPVTVDPQATDTVTVTLQAIANCDVTVDVTLVGAGGTSVGQAVSFAARVAPTVENVGTVVVAIFLVIGLVLGIVRTVRRGRSARRGTRAAPEDIGPLRVLGGGHVFGADTGTAGGTGRAGRPHAAHRTPDSPSVPLPGPIAPPDQPPDPHPVAPPATPPAFPPGEDRP